MVISREDHRRACVVRKFPDKTFVLCWWSCIAIQWLGLSRFTIYVKGIIQKERHLSYHLPSKWVSFMSNKWMSWMPANAGQNYITKNASAIHGALTTCRHYCPIICLVIFEVFILYSRNRVAEHSWDSTPDPPIILYSLVALLGDTCSFTATNFKEMPEDIGSPHWAPCC